MCLFVLQNKTKKVFFNYCEFFGCSLPAASSFPTYNRYLCIYIHIYLYMYVYMYMHAHIYRIEPSHTHNMQYDMLSMLRMLCMLCVYVSITIEHTQDGNVAEAAERRKHLSMRPP